MPYCVRDTVILAMCSSSDSHIGSGQSDNPGFHRGKNDTTYPIQHSVAALQSSMQMLAIATRPLKTAHAAQGKQSRYVTVQQSRGKLTGIVAACVSVLLVGYLLACVMWNRTQDQERHKRQVTTAGFKRRRLREACIHTQPSRFSQQPLDSNQATGTQHRTTASKRRRENLPSATISGSEPSTPQQQCRWTALTVPGALVGEPGPQGHRQLLHQQVRLQRQSEQT